MSKEFHIFKTKGACIIFQVFCQRISFHSHFGIDTVKLIFVSSIFMTTAEKYLFQTIWTPAVIERALTYLRSTFVVIIVIVRVIFTCFSWLAPSFGPSTCSSASLPIQSFSKYVISEKHIRYPIHCTKWDTPYIVQNAIESAKAITWQVLLLFFHCSSLWANTFGAFYFIKHLNCSVSEIGTTFVNHH